MEIKIYAQNMDGKKRLIDTCITDSPVRAIQAYDNEDYLQDDEVVFYCVVPATDERH